MILWIIVFLCTISHDKELAHNIGTRYIFSSISSLSEICKQKVEKKAKNTMKLIILNWNIRFCRIKSVLSLPRKTQNTWICIDVVTKNNTEKRPFMKNWSRTKKSQNETIGYGYFISWRALLSPLWGTGTSSKRLILTVVDTTILLYTDHKAGAA